MSSFSLELRQGQLVAFSATKRQGVLYDHIVDVYEDGVKTATYRNGIAKAFIFGPKAGAGKKAVQLSLWFDANNGHSAGDYVVVTGSDPHWTLYCHDSGDFEGTYIADFLVEVEIKRALGVVGPQDETFSLMSST